MPSQQFNISRLSPLFEYLKKQRDIEKSRRIFELATTFALISFFLFFAVRPTILTISTLMGDIKSKEILTIKMKTKIDQIITAQDNFSLVQEKYYLVEEALPLTQDFVGTFSRIDTASENNAINIDKLDFIQSEKNYFSTQISTRSSFSSSLGLIDTLFQSRRLLEVPLITFSQDKESLSNSQINFTVPINLFYWKNRNEKK